MNERGNITVQPFINQFGSWNEAVRAAGYEPHTTYTKDELLGIIHKLADDDTPPSSTELTSEELPGVGTYAYHFGSWNKALEEAGYEPQERKNISKNALIKEIQRIGGERAPPAYSDMDESKFGPRTYLRKFGSWQAAVREAGYEDTLSGSEFSDETLLEEIKHLGDNNNPPTIREMIERGSFDIDRYERRWETWTEAVKDAGYENIKPNTDIEGVENKQTTIDDCAKDWIESFDELLLQEIHDLTEGSEPPTQKEMQVNGTFNLNRYLKRWGSWNQAVQTAGYHPNPKPENNIGKKQLIHALQQLGNKLGRTPSVSEVNELGRYSEGPYLREFGSWWAALVESGFRPPRMYPLTPESFQKLFERAVADREHQPHQSLLTLLFQFTGVPPSVAVELSQDMIYDLNGDVGIRIPADQTKKESPWEFLVPEHWYDPIKNKRRPTQLPGFLLWFFNQYQEIYNINRRTSTHGILYDIAHDAGLLEDRQSIEYNGENTPKVTPVDLRFTHGIHLRINGAPDDYIRQRLGLDYVTTYITLDKIDFWIDQNPDIYQDIDD